MFFMQILVIVNNKPSHVTRDARSHWYCELGSDHFILISNFTMLKKYAKLKTQRTKTSPGEAYKIYLLCQKRDFPTKRDNSRLRA